MFVLLILVVVVAAGMVSIYLISNIRTEDPYVYQFLENEVWGDKRRRDPYPALNFTIDCSRLDNESQDDCREFLYNQENVLYSEMKKMTGIDLRWCFHTVNMIVYEGDMPCSNPKALGCAREDETDDIAHIAYSTYDVIYNPCKMDSHELQHVFDFCAGIPSPLREATTIWGNMAGKRVCPEYQDPRGLDVLLYKRLREDPEWGMFKITDCLRTQADVIYNSDEEFMQKFYEWVLQDYLRNPKGEKELSDAIIYAYNYENDSYLNDIKKHCMGWSETQGNVSIVSAYCQDNIIRVEVMNEGDEDMRDLLWFVDGFLAQPDGYEECMFFMCRSRGRDYELGPSEKIAGKFESESGEHNITVMGPKNQASELVTC